MTGLAADVEEWMGGRLADEEFGGTAIDVEEAFLARYRDCSWLRQGVAPDLEAELEWKEGKEVELSEIRHCRGNHNRNRLCKIVGIRFVDGRDCLMWEVFVVEVFE